MNNFAFVGADSQTRHGRAAAALSGLAQGPAGRQRRGRRRFKFQARRQAPLASGSGCAAWFVSPPPPPLQSPALRLTSALRVCMRRQAVTHGCGWRGRRRAGSVVASWWSFTIPQGQRQALAGCRRRRGRCSACCGSAVLRGRAKRWREGVHHAERVQPDHTRPRHGGTGPVGHRIHGPLHRGAGARMEGGGEGGGLQASAEARSSGYTMGAWRGWRAVVWLHVKCGAVGWAAFVGLHDGCMAWLGWGRRLARWARGVVEVRPSACTMGSRCGWHALAGMHDGRVAWLSRACLLARWARGVVEVRPSACTMGAWRV
jgi:hypothetical protein